MTDHHAEYEAAARRPDPDQMRADVEALRDQHRAAADNTTSWWRADRHRARANMLAHLLRKWGAE